MDFAYNQKKRNIRFSIRRKLLLMSLIAALPFLLLAMYLLTSMLNYSRNYDEIVNNITVANNYNLVFKEEMDESLYKLVVGYVSFDEIAQDPALQDPYALIRDCREASSRLMDMTTEGESMMWLQSMLRNIDTLEKRVDYMRKSALAGGNYNENIQELDNNIYILTELIQEDIQYYIYYQTRSMEKVSRQLHQQINQFLILCSVLTAALALLVVDVTFLIAKGILHPIQELYEATEKVAEGDFSVRARIHTQDEIAALGQGFNNMAENIQMLVHQIREDEEKMRRMDLRLLQEQINPHFLYNTLDTIVWLIEGNETDQAVNMVITLSGFFRLVLSKGKEFITIREEEEHIRRYLEIQGMRYRDILEYDIQLDQTVYDFQIPKLTLQPLVENALYHGIKYKRARGYIHIHGEKDGSIIRLTVRDNGAGMDGEELEQLRREIQRPCKEAEKGFGLANVNERIHMYFGEEYGLRIYSAKGRGTMVEVIIPAVRMAREALHPHESAVQKAEPG